LEAKKSMMEALMCGFRVVHGMASSFKWIYSGKLWPFATDLDNCHEVAGKEDLLDAIHAKERPCKMSARQKREETYFASGDDFASPGELKCAVPDGRTARPGRNIRLFAFGVSRTWMKSERKRDP
jgi:hypothetical protein